MDKDNVELIEATVKGLQDTYQLVEMIVDKVSNLFKEVDCPEDGHFTESIKEQTS